MYPCRKMFMRCYERDTSSITAKGLRLVNTQNNSSIRNVHKKRANYFITNHKWHRDTSSVVTQERFCDARDFFIFHKNKRIKYRNNIRKILRCTKTEQSKNKKWIRSEKSRRTRTFSLALSFAPCPPPPSHFKVGKAFHRFIRAVNTVQQRAKER